MSSRTPADYARTMLRIQREQHTGMLRVRSGPAETRIFFHKGRAVLAEGGTVTDSLGRLLVEESIIDEETYATTIESLPAGDDRAHDMQVGQALIQAGKVTGDELSKALAIQVRRKIERGLSLSTMTLAFNPLDEMPKGTPKFPCRIEPCILSGTRRYFGRRGAAHYVGGLRESYLALRDAPQSVAERFAMNTQEARFLVNLNGAVKTSRYLGDGQNASAAFDANVVTAALVLAAELTISSTPHADAAHAEEAPPKSLRTAKVSARAGQSERPPDTDARASDPDISHRPSQPSMLPSSGRRSERSPSSDSPPSSGRGSPISSRPPRSSFPQARISQLSMPAVDMPGPPSARAPASVSPPPMGKGKAFAEKAFQRGLRHVRAEQWGLAANELTQATDAMPEVSEYKLYAAWAAYRVCPLEEERSIQRIELEDLAREMTKENRHHGFPPYVLGHLALAAEDSERALKLFTMAAKHDPKNRDAERHVRLLTSRVKAKVGQSDKAR